MCQLFRRSTETAYQGLGKAIILVQTMAILVDVKFVLRASRRNYGEVAVKVWLLIV